MQFSYQKLEIYFVVGDSKIPISKRSAKSHSLFRMCFSYSSFHRLLICDTAKNDFVLYFHYLEPPLLYRADYKYNEDEENNKESYYGNKQCVSLDSCCTKDVVWFREVNLYEDCPPALKLEFSMNTVLRLKMNKSEYMSIGHLLQQFCKDLKPVFTPMRVVEAAGTPQIHSITSKDFNCFYALKCISTRSYEHMDQLSVLNQVKEANDFFREKCKENSKVLAEVLRHIYNQMDQGCIVMFLPAVQYLYEKLHKPNNLKNFKNRSESKILYIKRAILTPTHFRFLPAQPQLYNRVLRSSKRGHFMRVLIRDIDSTRINLILSRSGMKQFGKFRAAFLEKYYMTPLTNGMKLGNRRYEFLGMSSSQLKSHSAWCYAKGDDGMSVEDIRHAIGDLDEIQETPKYMARLGQSFSQAMASITVPQNLTNNNNPEPDICGNQKVYMSDDEDKGSTTKFLEGKFLDDDEQNDQDLSLKEKIDDRYIFSDGIGRMSQKIADKIYKELSLKEEAPSAVQIRYAGCKGMLVIDPRLEGEQILFRESMKKYNSDNDSLEILKISKPRNVHLNRPLITILEQKGISKDVFLKLQKLMIHKLIKSMFYDDDARDLLRTKLNMIDFIRLFDVGISFTEDPLFRSMILAIFRSQIYLLKHKSRIALPETKARNMFGVLDEYKVLNYEEVFVQYTEMNSTVIKILTGNVVVTKSPCLHSGDVRRFTAVDRPELRHIRDCIVFPAQGGRPHPDEMAGSDLDGDEYTVVWLEDLIFDSPNSVPMNYAVSKKSKKLSKNHPIQVSDELKHFCNYILNDTVGLLANAHLARADYEPDGINSKTCIKIAKKHAKAVDFAKTGQKAIMTKDERTYKYPDFMEKESFNVTYPSKKALGYLYRNCKNLEIGLEATTDMMEFRLDPDLEHKGWMKYQDSARCDYHLYCQKISYTLKNYSMDTEGEFLAGMYIKPSKLVSDSNEFRNLQDLIEQEVIWLFSDFEKRFFEEFGGKRIPYSEDMLMKASAWYRAAYKDPVLFGETRYFGLPWIVSDVLATLKKKNRKNFALSNNIFIKKASFMEEIVDKAIEKYRPWKHIIDDDALLLKNEIVDIARSALDKWLKYQNRSFIHTNRRDIEKHMDCEFGDVTEKLLCSSDEYIVKCFKEGNDKRAFSPGHYILSTLIQISEMGTGHLDLNVCFSSPMQQFGLCAWVTLVRLACSCNIEHLGILDKDSDASTLQITEEVLCQNFLMKTNDKFEKAYQINEKSICKYFLQICKMKDIAIHYDADESQFRIFVKGTQYNIDRLKEMSTNSLFIEQILCAIQKKEKSAT